jgi:sec-independent protein translocase protein TatA
MFPKFGPVELLLILVMLVMLFGVGKMPETFGSVGKGIRAFRRNMSDTNDGTTSAPPQTASAPSAKSSDKTAK